jgi:diguanylate cyclase (GGDEF)-like protein
MNLSDERGLMPPRAAEPAAWWRDALARPTLLVLLLLPLLHFACVKLTFLTAMTPENEVVVWLPNALLLAALLHYRGQRALAMAALVLASEVIGNLAHFPPAQALAVSLCNQTEVFFAFWLMRRLQVSPGLERIGDFARFVLCGPILGALLGALLAAAVLRTLPTVSAPYPTLMLLWWFGDALGLLIFTPLILSFLRPWGPPRGRRLHGFDALVLLANLLLAALIFGGFGDLGGERLLTPNLLLPGVLYVAARLGTRWTALAVALLALLAAWSQTTGLRPFGDASPHGMVLRAQEFILTLSIAGMGFAILFGVQHRQALELEDKVRERTQELEDANARLARLSTLDGLTGIANRRLFDEVLAREWARCARHGEPLALALLDVDHFKRYNDCYGHQTGDDALRLVAQTLSAGLRRSSDFVARYGGEEFAFIAPGTDAATARALAEQLCAALRAQQQPHAGAPSGLLTASVGVAVGLPGSDDSADALLRRADAALYAAKASGRDRAVLADH